MGTIETNKQAKSLPKVTACIMYGIYCAWHHLCQMMNLIWDPFY